MTDEASAHLHPDDGPSVVPGDGDSGSDALLARLRRVGRTPRGDDLARTEPPPGLWDRIAAATTTSSSAGAPGSGMSAGGAVEYCIDASDVVVAVDAGWRRFARDNGAPELADPDPTRTVWDSFADDGTRDLWRAIVTQVRATGVTARVPLRCDGPDARRFLDMTVTSEGAGRVRFRSVLVFEDARPTVELLAADAVREGGAPAVELCSWCARGLDGQRWVTVDELVLRHRLLEGPPSPPVHHGICPRCRNDMSAEAERLRSAGSRA